MTLDRNIEVVWPPVVRGYEPFMQIMRPTEDTTTVPGGLDAGITYAVIETDEAERIILQGMSQEEVDAKLEDFLTWAS